MRLRLKDVIVVFGWVASGPDGVRCDVICGGGGGVGVAGIN